MSAVRFCPEAPFFHSLRLWRNRQTRYLEGVVEVTPCEFKSHQPHQLHITHAVVAELADALDLGSSGF